MICCNKLQIYRVFYFLFDIVSLCNLSTHHLIFPPHSSKSLDISIKIVQPAIDLIEIISQRGNTSLEPAVARTLQLRKEIDAFAHKITMETSTAEADDTAKMRKFDHMSMIKDMQALTNKIEKFVPYLNLVLTTSGTNVGRNKMTIVYSSFVRTSLLLILYSLFSFSWLSAWLVPSQFCQSITINAGILSAE